jgi:hypothetical protein
MTEQVYFVEWGDCSAYVRAVSRDKAKARAMRSAREAGYWKPGQSLKGLRAIVATYVPPDVAVMES